MSVFGALASCTCEVATQLILYFPNYSSKVELMPEYLYSNHPIKTRQNNANAGNKTQLKLNWLNNLAISSLVLLI